MYFEYLTTTRKRADRSRPKQTSSITCVLLKKNSTLPTYQVHITSYIVYQVAQIGCSDLRSIICSISYQVRMLRIFVPDTQRQQLHFTIISIVRSKYCMTAYEERCTQFKSIRSKVIVKIRPGLSACHEKTLHEISVGSWFQ